MTSSSSHVEVEVNILGLLGVVFLCAKIFGLEPVASWSWAWVLVPFWGPFALFATLMGIGVLICWAANFFTGRTRRNFPRRLH